MVKIIQGDLLSLKDGILVHQVNCRGVMGSGIALSIRNKYPKAFTDYTSFVANTTFAESLLGNVNFSKVTEDLIVANLFGQLNYGLSGVFTDYAALEKGLTTVRDFAVSEGLHVGIPFGIGCVRGGADWNIVHKMIETIFNDVDCTLYLLK